MTAGPTVLFVCPHGAAKSVIAAAYFDRLAARRGLATRAAFRGTDPDAALAPAVVEALRGEGLDLSGGVPRRLAREDLLSAVRVIDLGCDPGALALEGIALERWDDVPAPSRDLDGARTRIAARVAALIDDLAGEGPRAGLWALVLYFLGLGALGFGGPIALAGFMHRDLVERRRWVTGDDYALGLALAQVMPGPLAAQLAIALGYFVHGAAGATLVGLAFVLPSFLMVVAISVAYVAYGGLWWMQALFYGIGAAVIAIIAIAAYRLARSTNRRDPLLWAIFGVLAAVTVWAQAELAEFFLVAGLLVLLVRATPRWVADRLPAFTRRLPALAAAPAAAAAAAAAAPASGHVLAQILLFFTKAGAFVFGSGLAIVPFLYQGVVQGYGWLDEQQFLDAVAVAMITPGPVVITVAFIGYLVAGLAGAAAAAVGIFLPVYLFTIVPAPWFRRNRQNAQLRAFVQGATAAATGAIAGAVVVLAGRAIVDLPTIAIAAASLVLLWRVRVPEPLLVLGAAAVGLAVWPLVR